MANGKKTGGRSAGTPNKATKELREKLQSIVEATVNDLESLLEQLPVEDRIKALTAILPYVVPKLSNVEVSGNDGGPIHVSLNLNPTRE